MGTLATPKPIVSPPTLNPRPYGLWSVVEDRSPTVTDSRWRNGVTWQDRCGVGGVTYQDDCREGDTPATKAANVGAPWFRATPFTVFDQVSCDGTASFGGGLSPVGYAVGELESLAASALAQTESYQVERAFWTGVAGGDADIVQPHLAANAAVTSTGEVVTVTLQCPATMVTGSTLLDVVEAVSSLEAALGSCLVGQGVIHVPLALGESLFRANIAKADGPRLMTQAGNLIALGGGYPGTGPDGSSDAVSAWIYATGPVFGYRSAIERFRLVESLDRSENTAKMIAERTYLLGFSCCCLYAARASLGGIVTGQPLSAS